jgi:hypothetical protein
MLCNKCHTEKPVDNFSYKDRDKGLRKKICRNCHSLYRKQHYLQNKDKYIEKANKWNTKQKEVISKYLFAKLSKSQCLDCGENDIIVLEFDHINNKKIGIAEMYKNSYSLRAIEEELNKCEIRCANCHRRKTAKESGFWKLKMSKQ